MSDENTSIVERRNVLRTIGLSGVAGLAGCLDSQAGSSSQGRTGNESSPQNQSTNASNGGNTPSTATTERSVSEKAYERIPVIDAYYGGEKVWFIHTDASTKDMAGMLTEMVEYPTQYAPKMADVVDVDAIADIYVFRNGVDRSDAEPWGGGPFGFQIDVLDSIPGDDGYTSIRNPALVEWNEDADPSVLKSVAEIMENRDAGKLTVSPTEMVVTAPVVRCPTCDQ
jgi:hypothetical protein